LMTHQTRAMQLAADPLFEIGNHSWTHRNMRVLSGSALKDQITKTQASYATLRHSLEQMTCFAKNPEAMSRIPRRMGLFRFPYGSCSQTALEAVAQQGLLAIQWDVATGDPWRGQSTKRITQTVLRRAKPGSIVLAHANGRGWHTAKALPMVIKGLRAKGFTFVTVSELLSAGTPVVAKDCYDRIPGDTRAYEPRSRRRAARSVKIKRIQRSSDRR